VNSFLRHVIREELRGEGRGQARKGMKQKDYAIWSVAKPLTLSLSLSLCHWYCNQQMENPRTKQPPNAGWGFAFRFSTPFAKFTI